MANFKGVYRDEVSGNVYYVNSQNEKSVNVSSVVLTKMGGMRLVLDCAREIRTNVFKGFYHSGNYTKDMINDK